MENATYVDDLAVVHVILVKAQKNIEIAAKSADVEQPATYAYWVLILLQLADREPDKKKRFKIYQEIVDKSKTLNMMGGTGMLTEPYNIYFSSYAEKLQRLNRAPSGRDVRFLHRCSAMQLWTVLRQRE